MHHKNILLQFNAFSVALPTPAFRKLSCRILTLKAEEQPFFVTLQKVFMQPEACMPLINRTVSIYHERELRRPVRKTEYLISPSTLPNSYSSHVGPPSLSLPLTEANLRRINLTTPFSCAHRPAEIVKQFTPPRLFKREP
jgi:hypothetical protein